MKTEVLSVHTENNRAKHRKIVTATVYYAFSILLGLILLFPYFYMLSKSFMGNYESQSNAPKLFPEALYLGAYRDAIDAKFLKYLGNTLYVLFFCMIGGTASALICAYGFAKQKWKGRELVFAIVLSTMMMPGIVLTIPLYVFYANTLHWLDTLHPLTVPSLFGGGAMNIFLIRQFMRGLPKEIDEAATIDGAGTLQHFFLIIVPLCKPIIVYLVVTAFMGAWNDFQGPLIYITDENKYTIPVGIFNRFKYMDYTGTSFPNVQMATGVILSLPRAILFIIFQKQLIDGITIGSVKG